MAHIWPGRVKRLHGITHNLFLAASSWQVSAPVARDDAHFRDPCSMRLCDHAQHAPDGYAMHGCK